MIAPLRVNLLLNNTQRRVNERDGLRTDGAHTRVLLYELVVYIHIYIHIMHNITTRSTTRSMDTRVVLLSRVVIRVVNYFHQARQTRHLIAYFCLIAHRLSA